jgi:small subunit ribosomal protein S20
MARHKSALKAARQAVKHADANTQARSRYRTVLKKVRTALTTKYANTDAAKKALEPLLNDAQKVLMKAASKGLIKRNTASRNISRLSAAVHRVLS